MAAIDVINSTSEIMPEILVQIGVLGKWLQALGIIVILWLVFQIVNLVINLKRKKMLKELQEDMKIIKAKLNKTQKKK